MANERFAPMDADTFDDRGPYWQECAGDYCTRSLVLEKGWYTVTWSLITMEDHEDIPIFRTKLFGEDGQLVMGLPLDEDSEAVGYHTMTVNVPADGFYFFQIHAENVTWKLALLRIPVRNSISNDPDR
ncbi:hypothetical protein [Marininema mesophilum]|uniref:hypothetical protein n=1 Tax=Marininema mesophilum TaxID=1048340 RepID=UPI00115FEE0D|nr:hypothetical protein [Marininema mesophilum]